MKRAIIKTLIVLICSLALVSLFGKEDILIDFSTLNADGFKSSVLDPSTGKKVDKFTQNISTLVDYSKIAGESATADDKKLMKTSLALDNWDIVLASSSRSVENRSLSYTKEWTTNDAAKKFPKSVVMGVRIHFPELPFNSWAMIKPPFEIPAYEDPTQGEDMAPVTDKPQGSKFINKGVVRNIGVIKQISIWVYGRNFKNGLSIILLDENNVQQEVFMGFLDFDGWKQLTWANPNYITEVRNRDLFKIPLYPKSQPYVKLSGLLIYRQGDYPGGDFVTYFHDISVIYDEAVLQLEEDINDEAAWNILNKAREDRKNTELSRIGQIQQLRFLEQKKMHQETSAQ